MTAPRPMQRLSATLERAGGGFVAKGLGLAAQLATLGLVTQMLGVGGFGTYALLLSVASVAAQLADFGLGRYQFRHAHRGASVAVLAMWSLAFRLVTTLLLLPPVLVYAAHRGLSPPALAFGFLANILIQFAGLNRHLLLVQDRVAAAILVESAPALLFCVAVTLCFVLAVPLGVAAVLFLYLLATIAGLLLSIAGAGTARSWAEAIRMLRRRRPRRLVAGIAALARGASPVGIDIVLAAATFQAPILIVAGLADGAATPQVGLYQRILGMEVAVLSVTVTSRLKGYHDCGGNRTLDLRPALAAGGVLFAINAAGLLLLAPIVALLPELRDMTLVALALSLRPHLVLLAAATACVAAYLHCSMAALGGDWLWQRCVSAAAGLATTLAATLLLSGAGVAPLRAVLLASLSGQLVAIGVLIAAVVQKGAHVRLPPLLPAQRRAAAGGTR